MSRYSEVKRYYDQGSYLLLCRYANRAKNIKNKPHINEDPKDALLREYQEEIQRLKLALDKRQRKGGRKGKRALEDGIYYIIDVCLQVPYTSPL